jgi:hypothetical protein
MRSSVAREPAPSGGLRELLRLAETQFHDAGLVESAGPRRWRIVSPLLGRYLRELEPLG